MENKRLNCLRCEYKHETNGNCLAVGGFCTAVPAAYCKKLQEYIDAEEQGRLAIRPVDLHQKIYRVFGGEILTEIVCDAIYKPLRPNPDWLIFWFGGGKCYWNEHFGKDVFLTREEAEAKLKEIEGENGTD